MITNIWVSIFFKVNRRESTDAIACSSKDAARDQPNGSCEVDIADIHHQYFTVATTFLRDIISESAKVRDCLLFWRRPNFLLRCYHKGCHAALNRMKHYKCDDPKHSCLQRRLKIEDPGLVLLVVMFLIHFLTGSQVCFKHVSTS